MVKSWFLALLTYFSNNNNNINNSLSQDTGSVKMPEVIFTVNYKLYLALTSNFSHFPSIPVWMSTSKSIAVSKHGFSQGNYYWKM